MKRKLTIILTLVLILILSFILCGCDAKLEDNEIEVKDYFTDGRISYVDGELKPKIITGTKAQEEISKLLNGTSELNAEKFNAIALFVKSNAKFTEMNIDYLATNLESGDVKAYYFNDGGVQFPSDFDSYSSVEREIFYNQNCRKEIGVLVGNGQIKLSADLDLKPATTEGSNSYIMIEFADKADVKVTSISGNVVEKIQPLGSRVVSALELMGYGMLSIFVVIVLIIVVVIILNKVTNRKKKTEEQTEEKLAE